MIKVALISVISKISDKFVPNLEYDDRMLETRLVNMETSPLSFYDEPIEVTFDKAPVLSKSPTCPAAFTWRGETYAIVEMLETWQDFQRRGRMERNMRPSHRIMAARRGSWGVGRFHFRVRVEGGRIFEIYYDRAPESAGDRKGHWFLLGERREG